MMRYTVTFVRKGYAEIEANSEQDAFAKIEGYGYDDVSWSDEFVAETAEKEESIPE